MKIPHTFTIVFSIIVLCAVMTWIIPGGEFNRQTVTVDGSERNVVVSDSYHNVDNQPQTWQIFTAFFKGFERTANIIVFILMIGGGFWIMNETNAINVGIFSFLKKTQKLQQNKILGKLGVNNLIMILIILMFSLFGSVFGMSEETIASQPLHHWHCPGLVGIGTLLRHRIPLHLLVCLHSDCHHLHPALCRLYQEKSHQIHHLRDRCVLARQASRGNGCGKPSLHPCHLGSLCFDWSCNGILRHSFSPHRHQHRQWPV